MSVLLQIKNLFHICNVLNLCKSLFRLQCLSSMNGWMKFSVKLQHSLFLLWLGLISSLLQVTPIFAYLKKMIQKWMKCKYDFFLLRMNYSLLRNEVLFIKPVNRWWDLYSPIYFSFFLCCKNDIFLVKRH